MRFQFTLLLATLALVSGGASVRTAKPSENGRTGFNHGKAATPEEIEAKREELRQKRAAQKKLQTNVNNGNASYFRGKPVSYDINDIPDPEVRAQLMEKRLEKMKRLQSLQTHKIINGKTVAAPDKDGSGNERKLARLNYW